MHSRPRSEPEITALLISPDRTLAESFRSAVSGARIFQVLADLKNYPAPQALEIRIRQLKPDVILLDLVSNLDGAIALIQAATAMSPPARVVGLHSSKDSQAVLRSLRAGALEFLNAPFDPETQSEAFNRLRRMIAPEPSQQPVETGRLVAFASSKPGSGASTLAAQTAFSIHRLTGKRVLLADCDLTGGTIAFYLKLSHAYSIVDALQHVERLDATLWKSLAVSHQGVDILPAPAVPYTEPVDPARLRALAEQARGFYDWVVLDLPSIFNPNSLMVVTDCDLAFVISTAELASLHMTRKAVQLLQQLGLPNERFQVVVNRMGRQEDISRADLEKLFGCGVHARLPSDYFSLHRVVTLGQPLGGDGELGRAIENIAKGLTGTFGARAAESVRELKPALLGA